MNGRALDDAPVARRVRWVARRSAVTRRFVALAVASVTAWALALLASCMPGTDRAPSAHSVPEVSEARVASGASSSFAPAVAPARSVAGAPVDPVETQSASRTGAAVAVAKGDQAAATQDATHELGRKVWNFRCYFCHGYAGDARTLAATYLSPKPRDFTEASATSLTAATMRDVITQGRDGTAMKGFAGILSPREIDAVAGFVRREFIEARAPNTRYHTEANGWPGHERHAVAFPFARGQIALDTPWEQLDASQRRGKRLFLEACVTCHDHARVRDAGPVWETRALSFPRDAYCTSCHEHPNGDGRRPEGDAPPGHPPVASRQTGMGTVVDPARSPRVAATYRVHDTPPKLQGAVSAQVRQGEALYQRNCAFCHAADGTAKNWIGRFLEPHPRDLTDATAMQGMTRERLRAVIEQGLEGSSMPGWKSVLSAGEIDAVMAYMHRAFHPVQGL